jgi:hypothetical protein
VLISADRKQWSRAAMAVIALLLTGTYSVCAALGSATGSRANAAIEEKDTTDKRTKAQAAYDAATAELAGLKPSRLVAEMEAVVEAAKPVCRIVVGNGYRGETCIKPATLTAELGRAKRRVELEQKIEQATADLAKTGPAKIANADAVALAAYLHAIGLTIDADRVNKLLVLVAVLCVEAGGGLALAVGLALSEGRPASGELREGYEKATSGADTTASPQVPVTAGVSQHADPSPKPRRSARDGLLELLASAKGPLRVGQEGLAEALGVTSARVRQVLKVLTAAGAIRVRTSPAGTTISLIEGGHA